MNSQIIRGFAFGLTVGVGLFGITFMSASARADVTWDILGTSSGQPDLVGVMTTPDLPVSCGGLPTACGVSGTLTFPAGALGGPGLTLNFETDVGLLNLNILTSPPSGDYFTFNFTTASGYACAPIGILQVICSLDGGPFSTFDLVLTERLPTVTIGNGNIVTSGQVSASGAHVQGGIQADKLTYNEPRKHYYTLGPGDWSITTSRHEVSTGFLGTYIFDHVDGLVDDFYATLHLPDGAFISELRAYVHDSHFIGATGGNIRIVLWRGEHGSRGGASLASVESIGFAGTREYVANFFQSTTLERTVDNQNYLYVVTVSADNWPDDSNPTNLSILSVVVTYTIGEAD